ncbi:hypothetical protein E8E14_001616 [Neopestalotiopsis sp. 37M]|nr:hypothetical protein E8E14_001616 [Neopestalotiopsis sp. 37M]
MFEGIAWDPDLLRSAFTHALSDMYRSEVPAYGTLVDIVHRVDGLRLASQGSKQELLRRRHELERHGAIRLGTEYELRTVKRLFALLGMHPVGYYNLATVGFPMHATAFRPISDIALETNPFRVFTTVLRRDLLSNDIRKMSDEILARRDLFSPRLLSLLEQAEAGSAMSHQNAEDLITEALKIFKWHSKSLVTMQEYLDLKSEHPMVADIACFPSAHINHLTPRTLDIELVQQQMLADGLPAKERIEGPPIRQCPILLRQTSFKALEEVVIFMDQGGKEVRGTHTARFGEVEQRGAAVTAKGRRLYDELLDQAIKEAGPRGTASSEFEKILARTFATYPDTWSELRSQRLVYFKYSTVSDDPGDELAETLGHLQQFDLGQLISLGLVKYEPITYEDFLPLSAAGIFRSNLDAHHQCVRQEQGADQRRELENMLDCKIQDELAIYTAMEEESIRMCATKLGFKQTESS